MFAVRTKFDEALNGEPKSVRPVTKQQVMLAAVGLQWRR